MDYESASLEKASDIEKNPSGVVKRWLLELKLADKREKDWRKESESVWGKYRQKDAKAHSFNILVPNTETLISNVYNSLPKPDVRRRFKDEDPMGKACSEVLSRALEYGMDTTDFDWNIKSTILDFLLPGRGIARVRYVPSLRPQEIEPNEGEAFEGESEELAWEQAPVEHVQWDDFRISAGKEWAEVCWVAFKHRLTREELEEQFGDVGSLVNLDDTDDDDINNERDDAVKESFKTAEVWEIWDKDETQVIFIAKGYKEGPLKVVSDPLGLQGFFPVPRPLYFMQDSSSLVPVAPFKLYEEQAKELDRVSKRINVLINGLKMRGIYDATLSELSELMRGEDNDLIPAQNVTALLERGGLEKAIWFMPIEQAASVLQVLREQRNECMNVIYQLTGLSDIQRGSSDPNETATAQQIKSQWGSSRLKKMQAEVQRFIRDVIRIQAEIIAEKFQPETLASMTGLKYPTAQEKQQAMMQGQQPQLLPSWEEIINVLRDDKQRTFKIDIETDSTVAASMEGDMQGLQEVLGGITQLVQGLGPAVQMGALPVEALKQIIMTVTRRAKMGNAVEDALDKIQQPPPPQAEQDNSAQIQQMRQQAEQQRHEQEMQHQQQVEAQKAQLEQAKLEHQSVVESQKLQSQQQVESLKAQLEASRLEFDKWKAELDANTKIVVAELQAKTSLATSQLSADTTLKTSAMGAANETTEFGEDGTSKPSAGLSSLVEAMNENMEKLMGAHAESTKAVIEAANRPKKFIRGPDGRVTGAE